MSNLRDNARRRLRAAFKRNEKAKQGFIAHRVSTRTLLDENARLARAIERFEADVRREFVEPLLAQRSVFDNVRFEGATRIFGRDDYSLLVNVNSTLLRRVGVDA